MQRKNFEKRKQMIKNNQAITLISLVITIVVSLILAGVSGLTLTGKNSIIEKAKEANQKTDIVSVEEQIDIELKKIYAKNGKYTNSDVIDVILKVTGKTVKVGEKTVVTSKGNTVNITDLWEKRDVNQKIISEEKEYIGYYADIDGNGKVDGIIYADLAHNKNYHKEYYNNYEYTAKTDLKNYYISKVNYSCEWGEAPYSKIITADVIAPIEGTTGNDRFYIMALKDFKNEKYDEFCWYYNLEFFNNGVNFDYNDFGEGKLNTINMINDWNNSKYGEQTVIGNEFHSIDLWGAIQDGQYDLVKSVDDSGKWFLASKSEMAAFSNCLLLYIEKELWDPVLLPNGFCLENAYWTSTQNLMDESYGSIELHHIFALTQAQYGDLETTSSTINLNVRLSATF